MVDTLVDKLPQKVDKLHNILYQIEIVNIEVLNNYKTNFVVVVIYLIVVKFVYFWQSAANV